MKRFFLTVLCGLSLFAVIATASLVSGKGWSDAWPLVVLGISDAYIFVSVLLDLIKEPT